MHDQVKDYYGKTLESSADLQTNACCTDDGMPDYLKSALSRVHDEVLSRYYGCGLVSPQQMRGCRILDLGCGSGRDCYVLSQFVGESGSVVGVDMTEEQLAIANKYVDYHTKAFGYARPNIEFREGYIEQLDALNLEENSFDVIVSNCVINLSPDKGAVFREAYRLLKPGGELYFSDVYSDRRLPAKLVADPVLYGECLGGALYWNDFLHLARNEGFGDPRLVDDRPIQLGNAAIEEKVGHIGFYSATYRLFKIAGLEPCCEDYGQAVIYQGTAEHHPHAFLLDKHHLMPTGKVFPVCGNTYRMLKESRFAQHFEFIGTDDVHYGVFEGCGTALPFDRFVSRQADSSGCC